LGQIGEAQKLRDFTEKGKPKKKKRCKHRRERRYHLLGRKKVVWGRNLSTEGNDEPLTEEKLESTKQRKKRDSRTFRKAKKDWTGRGTEGVD